ncbi:MAG: AraC family transcriptional regulator [Mariniphaga sp.]|nr:AraC family transcriptional regulator [Mariniphaga sp.]MDD4425252.1 AraC family transcriptional regulator [Mariniphaga sp.]
MVKVLRHYLFHASILEEQQVNPLTSSLYLTEIGEVEVEEGSIWNVEGRAGSCLLAFCIKGEGFVLLLGEQIPVSNDQYFIVPPGEGFKFYSELKTRSRFLFAGFSGVNSRQMTKEFALVRNLVPSVNNRVANREMLFDEIFNNLSKGYHNQNLEYIHFCFGHLLATFVYAYRTSDDLADELNPVVRRTIQFLERNLHQKLSLQQIAHEAGYSPTYLSTLFRKVTNYAPLSYFAHLKILKACEFLDYTRLKVKDISYRLGYSDPYYFTRDFKNKMGMSPRQYRNRIRG